MQLDKFQQIAADCKVGAVILGNVNNEDFQLWPLGQEIPADLDRRLRVRGLCFLGVMGISGFVNGVPESRCALVDPLTERMRAAIIAEFGHLYTRAAEQVEEQEMGARSAGDSITWLERLHCFPDTRCARDKRGPYEA